MVKHKALGDSPTLSWIRDTSTNLSKAGVVQKTPENTKKHISRNAEKHISKTKESDKLRVIKPKEEKKIHISIWVNEKMWENIKENAIKSNLKISEYAAQDLTRKAEKHISISTDKHINSSRHGKVQLSLFLPESLLVNIKLQALKLRIPYSVLIIEKLKR